ncbi:glycoside hydrolase family protein [Candidatus Saccharibacteria bacterium]|nr:glycoside hydrolase family protein [Candidatus Saccharibacteria bacterium]
MNDKWLYYTRQFEGFAPLPYKDSTGHLTVGYGHNLENGITLKMAEFILKCDIETAERAVKDKFAWYFKLNDARQFVLIDMAFNMGIARLCTFKKMLAAVERGDYTTAAKEMLDSRWALQVKTRAVKLAEMMKTGEYV